MAQIDTSKEKINYLKVWLGIVIITNISIISWFVNNFNNKINLRIITSIIVIVLLSLSVVFIDNQIRKVIDSLKEL